VLRRVLCWKPPQPQPPPPPAELVEALAESIWQLPSEDDLARSSAEDLAERIEGVPDVRHRLQQLAAALQHHLPPPCPPPCPDESALSRTSHMILTALADAYPSALDQYEIGEKAKLSRSTVYRNLSKHLRPRGLTNPLVAGGEAITEAGRQ